MDLVSQWFLEQMLGLGYFASSISLNVLAVRPMPRNRALTLLSLNLATQCTLWVLLHT